MKRINGLFCLLAVVALFAAGCTQSPMYSFHSVDNKNLSNAEKENISGVGLHIVGGHTIRDDVFTRVITKDGTEVIYVTGKDGVTTTKLIVDATGGVASGILPAATLGIFQYKAAGRQSDNIAAAGGEGGKGTGTGVGVVGDNNDISTGN